MITWGFIKYFSCYLSFFPHFSYYIGLSLPFPSSRLSSQFSVFLFISPASCCSILKVTSIAPHACVLFNIKTWFKLDRETWLNSHDKHMIIIYRFIKTIIIEPRNNILGFKIQKKCLNIMTFLGTQFLYSLI